LAISENGLALEHASEKLQSDFQLALLAVRKNGSALEFVNEAVNKRLEIVKEALK
jgi:hypothetical protein